MCYRVILCVISFLGVSIWASANGLQISNVSVKRYNNGRAFVKLDAHWENSWRDIENHDAVWLFVKYRKNGGSWQHASIEDLPFGNHVPPNVFLDVAEDDMGAFVYRSEAGSGSIDVSGLELIWGYRGDGVDITDSIEVKVFGVEMVYVPRGSFGINAAESAQQTAEFVSVGGSLTTITSEDALQPGAIKWPSDAMSGGIGHAATVNGRLFYGSDSLASAYPKGYKGFFCMKYELSQNMYVDFLNALTRRQQISLCASDVSGNQVNNVYVLSNTSSSSYRNTVYCPANGNGVSNPIRFSTDRPYRACSQVGWLGGAAYLDWAGLRPMSELELEKIARGNTAPAANEYAWGNGVIASAKTIIGAENGEEQFETTAGQNAVYGGGTYIGGDMGGGPVRVGILARAETTRQASGASYWGVMDMSGNLSEQVVTVAGFDENNQQTNAGLFNRDDTGDGQITETGKANQLTWPSSSAIGIGLRMGSWSDDGIKLTVSDRTRGASSDSSRLNNASVRGVRTFDHVKGVITTGSVSPVRYHGGSYGGYAASSANKVLLDIENMAIQPMLDIYPNPCEGKLFIRVEEDVVLSLKDMIGQELQTLTLPKGITQLQLDGYSEGVYVLSVSNKQGQLITTRKIFKGKR